MDANPALYAGIGAAPSNTSINATIAALGSCPAAAVAAMPGAKLHTWNATDASRVTSLSYCFADAPVFFSTVPVDAYLGTAAFRNLQTNALGVFSNDITCSPPSPPPPPPPSPPPTSPPPPPPPSPPPPSAPPPPMGSSLSLVGRAGCRSKLGRLTRVACCLQPACAAGLMF